MMGTWWLAGRELRRRPMWAGLNACCLGAAVAVLTGTQVTLRQHDADTRRVMRESEERLREEIEALDDDVRSAVSRLGFNIVVLPREQNLADWYAEDYASKSMPESYVERLAELDVVTIGHLVPRLRRKTLWPERGWTVIVVGTGDTTWEPAGEAQEWAVEAVAPGGVALGSEIWSALGIGVGETIRLLDREFTVRACHEERGVKDDITIWMHLRDAQELFALPGQINEILALACRAAWSNLPAVRAAVAERLPDTQVVELSSAALARTEAREAVVRRGRSAIEGEAAKRALWRRRRLQLGAILTALAVMFFGAAVALATGEDARRRAGETAMLVAVGFRPRCIFRLFMWRAVVLGLAGGLIGFAAGAAAAGRAGAPAWIEVDWSLAAGAVFVSIAVSVAASGIPALLAARRDPASVLTSV